MDFDLSTEIAAPPEHVFDHLAEAQDQGAEPRSMVLAMEKIPPGPTELDTVAISGRGDHGTSMRRAPRCGPVRCRSRRRRRPTGPDRRRPPVVSQRTSKAGNAEASEARASTSSGSVGTAAVRLS
jgi:hypothetical protein